MLVQAAFIAASFANLCAKLANVFGIRAVARHGLKCESAHLRAFPVKSDAFGHHPRVFFHQTFVKAVIACFKAFPAGFDAFLVYRFHEIHSFFLRFPFVVPCFKIGKTCEKNCCTSCTAVLVIRRDLDGSGQGFLSSSYNRNLPLHRAFRSNR